MPTGIDPNRYIKGFQWDEYKWRKGELEAQFEGMTVMVSHTGCTVLLVCVVLN